jgi:hypothetical protein
MAQAMHGLDQGDALIYSAVLLDARARGPEEPKTLIARNSSDFDRQSIRDELEALMRNELRARLTDSTSTLERADPAPIHGVCASSLARSRLVRSAYRRHLGSACLGDWRTSSRTAPRDTRKLAALRHLVLCLKPGL